MDIIDHVIWARDFPESTHITFRKNDPSVPPSLTHWYTQEHARHSPAECVRSHTLQCVLLRPPTLSQVPDATLGPSLRKFPIFSVIGRILSRQTVTNFRWKYFVKSLPKTNTQSHHTATRTFIATCKLQWFCVFWMHLTTAVAWQAHGHCNRCNHKRLTPR